MDTHDEILFGRIAVLSKFVTQEQIDECIMQQEERIRTNPEDHLHLGTILVEKKYLTEREKRAILQVQKENLQKRDSGSTARRQERIFGYLVMRLGYCDEQQVYECVREQARLARFNLFFKLGEVFVSKVYLQHDQVEEILALQGKFIVTCPGCKTKFNVVRYQAGSKVKCPECGTIITVPDVLEELGKYKKNSQIETRTDFTIPGVSADKPDESVSETEPVSETIYDVKHENGNEQVEGDKAKKIEKALDEITDEIRKRDQNYQISSDDEN